MASLPLPVLSFGPVDPPPASSLPPFPSICLGEAGDVNDPTQVDFQHVLRAVIKAKRIAVVCGAGISCASGIPDFRSSQGLFESLKKQHPEARLASGKDLFDASLFQSEQNAAIFHTMIAELKQMADRSEPTAFHSFLKSLDDSGKLFRVYTQNIDGLEEKVGLSYGLGDKSLPLPPRRAPRNSPSKPSSGASTPAPPPVSLKRAIKTSSLAAAAYPSPAPSPPPSSPPSHTVIPRCIPLHGHLATLTCPHCSTTHPIAPYLDTLSAGTAPSCPECLMIERARTSVGERSRGVGKLRPDVVLYGEEHKDGERVGEITRRDLMGVRPDLLLVVGTSLKVPGTKRLVRELSKVIRPPVKEEEEDTEDTPPVASGSSTATTTSGRARKPRQRPVHAVYLNYEFPTPSREWQGIFDVWMRGDVQGFVAAVKDERQREQDRADERERKKIAAAVKGKEKEKEKASVAAGNGQGKKQTASKVTGASTSKTKSAGGAAAVRKPINANKTKSGPTAAAAARSRKSPTPRSTAPPAKQTFTLSFPVTKSSFAMVTGTKTRSRRGSTT